MNTKRYHDIDWLRVLAMMMVFLFHCARFFNDEDWHVKNNEISMGATVFVIFVSRWIMPLFFVLSGISSRYALQHRTGGQFVQERVKRLLVPLIFGILILIPPQVYIERITHGQFEGSFFQFYPHYFDGWYAFGGNFAWMGLHLWYLEFLFLFSLLVLPLFLYWKKRDWAGKFSGIARFFSRPGAILLLFTLLCVVEMIVGLDRDGFGRRELGGWSVFVYLVFFILGYLISTEEKFRTGIEKSRWLSLLTALVVTVAGYFIITGRFFVPGFMEAVLQTLNAWAWILVFLGFGSRYLTRSNRFLVYANEAVLPFYILHQTVIVILGFAIARRSWDVSVKFGLLTVFSFLIIMGVYEFLLRRNNLMRFLFGMKKIPPLASF
ncbi:MAG: acyltransferase family protein [Bacteroidales bacterium]|nr:acyltransferase family protein [Bacteroidales bacterium]